MAIPAISSVTEFEGKKEYVPVSQTIYLAMNVGTQPPPTATDTTSFLQAMLDRIKSMP